MTPNRLRRKAELKAALAYLGLSQAKWCAALNIDASHLARVLTGERQSIKLDNEIDGVIEEFRQKFCDDSLSPDASSKAA